MISAALRARWARARLLPPLSSSRAARAGAHRSRRTGLSHDLAEHRDYVPGDDLRHLDWSAYARHERLVTRLFSAEVERTVLLVVDSSASMAGPKAERSRQLAALLAWVALGGGDRVALASLTGPRIDYHPPVRSRSGYGRLCDWLAARPLQGAADLAQRWPEAASRLPRSGLTVLLSDALEAGATDALAPLRWGHHSAAVLQLLDAADRQQPGSDLADGPFALRDVESGEERRLTLDDAARAAYRAALQAHGQALQQACRRYNFAWHSLPAEQPLDAMLSSLRAEGWLWD